MKRFFVLFLSVLVCLSLCINIAFAQTQYDSYIHAYFPWFGGVGTAGAYLTNTGTVTTSDVTFTGVTVTNKVSGFGSNYMSNNGSVSGGSLSFNGTPSSTQNLQNIVSGVSLVSGHVYLLDTFNTGNFAGISFGSYGLSSRSNQVVWTSTASGAAGGGSVLFANTAYDFTISPIIVDLTSIFGAGSEPTTYQDAVNALSALLGGYSYFSGSVSSGISSFSLVPQSSVIYDVEQYTHDFDSFSFDVSLDGTNIIEQGISNILYDDTYSYYLGWLNGSSIFNIYYGTSDSLDNYPSSNFSYVPYTLGTDASSYQVNNAYQPDYVGYNVLVMVDPSKLSFSLTTSNGYIAVPVNDSSLLRISNNRNRGFNVGTTDYLLHLDNYFADSSASFTGTISLDSVSNKEIYHTVIYSNNTVNLGTYDFNINVVFPSLDKFNAFSGYWLGSFNTSWGEIPVRTEVQEVSSNSNTLIKIYKVTFDVPFTGSYTSFNIKYVGDSSAFTTIRVDSSVIDPKAYNPTQNQVTSLNGFTGWLNGALDSLWGKIRSLFFDQDQTYQQVAQSSSSSELAEGASEVSDGASTIHEYETENFDSIEQQMDSLDWEIPNDFGSADDPSSAIGFISTFFGGIFLALGSKVQVLIVIPLMLGLCLLILGRGSQALGAINKLFR